MADILAILFTALALSIFSSTMFSSNNKIKAISVIWLVALVIAAPAINAEWARMSNLLLEDDHSHNGLPKEWENKQVLCVHFPEDSIPLDFVDGRHHFNTAGEEVFVDTLWNNSGACIGGYVDYESGFNFMLDATNATGGNLEVNYLESSWGIYITSIGGHEPTGNSYWSLYHNGVESMVGIGDLILENNSVVVWQVATW
jgi:hypothetical protein